MASSPEAPRRRPSRIYAGIELSQPVNLAVPVALCFVVYALLRLRGFYQGLHERLSAAEWRWRYGTSEPEGVDSYHLDQAALESALVWLIVAVIACVLGVVIRWWRGRREWGDVPLAHGLGVYGYAYVFASWVSFDDRGLVALIDMEMASPSAVVFLLTLGFLVYITLELFTRRWRERRWLFGALVALLMLVPLVGLNIVETAFERGTSFEEGGPSLMIDLPRVLEPFDAANGPLGADCGTAVYVQLGEELWLARGGCGDKAWRLEGWLRLEPAMEESAEKAQLEAEYEELARRTPPRSWPAVAVALPHDAPPSKLTEIAADVKNRFPKVVVMNVIGTTGASPVRGRVFPRRGMLNWLDHSVLMRVEVYPREQSITVDTMSVDAIRDAIRTWERANGAIRYADDRELSVQLRLRVGPGTTLEQLGTIYYEVVSRHDVLVYIEPGV
jgi:hypothetical protein